MSRDRDRRKSQFNQGLRALIRGDTERAERMFRVSGSSMGLAIAALHARAWERAATKALDFLSFYDELDQDDEKRIPDDEALMLRTLAIAMERLEEETVRGAAQQRREAVVKRARKRLENVEWEAVLRRVRKSVHISPEIFSPLVTTRLGRRLVREGLATAADILLEGDYHHAMSVVSRLNQIESGRKEGIEVPICPHCLEDVSELPPEEARAFMLDMRTYADIFQARNREEPEDLEHALLSGVEALHMAEYLARGGHPVEDVLVLSDSLLRAATGLAPSGKMAKMDKRLISACVSYHRARAAEVRRAFEDAAPLLEDVASKHVEPWSERAEEALVRIRAICDAEARRRAVAELRGRYETARKEGDSAEERAALTELMRIAADDALLERLAQLELEEKASGWTGHAAEAVRRGSKNPALLGALAEEAARIAEERPKEAIALFRLALQGVPLSQDSSGVFAAALLATGRSAEAGRVYRDLGVLQPRRYLDAAKAYAVDGDVRRVLSAVDSLLEADVPLEQQSEGYRLAASLASPDALRSLAEKMLARDAKHSEAREVLERLRARDYQVMLDAATQARSNGLDAFARRDWPRAAERLTVIPEEFRDEEVRRALARTSEEIGRTEGALRMYEALRPSRDILEGRARCQARLRRFSDARETVRLLLDSVGEDEAPDVDGDPDLRGLLAEARGNLRGAAGLYEDRVLLSSLSEVARNAGDAVAEFEALSRLANRYPELTSQARGRLKALDALVPVRAKERYRTGLPTLVLCDTNVLVAELVENPSMPEELGDLRRPSSALRLRDLRASKDVRVAVTRAVARELRSVLLYRYSIEQDEEVAEALRALVANADGLTDSLDMARVANVTPRTGATDIERVREFYRPFRKRLRKITEKKAQRAPDRSAAIKHRRTRGRPKATALPERTDLRLLADAAWLVDAPVPGIGGIGIMSDDADFRDFQKEIEHAFRVRVY